MIDPSQNLESRLAGLRPTPITPALGPRIATRLARPQPTRLAVGSFWTAIGGGAIAASIIIAMLTSQTTVASRRGTSNLAMNNPPQTNSAPTALARADWRWADDLNLNDDRRIP